MRGKNFNQRSFFQLIDQVKLIAVFLDPEGKVTYVNQFFNELSGYSAGEVEGMNWFDSIMPGYNDAEVKEILDSFNEHGDVPEIKPYIRLKNGETRPIRWHITLIKEESGPATGISLLGEDVSESVAWDNSLKESRLLYETLVNQAADAYFVHDFDGRFVEVNAKACESLGYTKEEFEKLTVVDIEQDFDLQAAQEQWAKIEPGVNFTLKGHQKRKDGSVFPVEVSFGCAIVNGRKLFMGLVRDISEREKVQKELAMSNENFFRTFELNPSALSITRISDGKLLLINKVFSELTGYSSDEIKDQGTSALNIYLYPEERRHTLSVLKKEGRIRNHELSIRNKAGEVRVIQVSMDKMIFDDEECILSAFSDITQKKNTELELSTHRDHLEEMVEKRTEEVRRYLAEVTDLYENSPCGYHSLNKDGQITRINKTELKWLGYEADELIGGPLTRILTEQSFQKFRNNFPAFLKRGKLDNLEMEFVRKDGSTFFVSINATVIYDDQKRFLYSRSTVFDITERKRNEEELQKAKLAAEQANRAKSEFLANMSHEIRTPMNAVLGYTELLGSTSTTAVQKSYIEAIRSSGRSLLTLINDILDLSKVEAGKLHLEYDYVSSYSFFNEFESIFALKVKEKKLKFIMDLADNIPNGLYVDEARLRQVIFNLLGNAIKFTSEGYISLKVYCQYSDNKAAREEEVRGLIDLIIEIQDTGTGISPENQKSIFEPFVQEKEFKKFGGTGLGLSISKRLIELMKGSLSLVSEPGKGSTFRILIPAIQYIETESQSAGEITIDLSKIIFDGSTILVVDDVKHNRDFIRDSLSPTTLRIVDAENGALAYKIACDTSPDLIITDIRMPEMDGFGLLEKLKSNQKLKDVPVIAYSAEVLKEQKERIRDSKFSGLMVKPVRVRDLYLELMNWLPYSIKDSISETAGPESLLNTGDIKELPELIKILETDYFKEWKKFEVRQPINEIREFGARLAKTGTIHNSKLISDYGNDLVSSADSFDVDKIISLIRRYPDLLSALKK